MSKHEGSNDYRRSEAPFVIRASGFFRHSDFNARHSSQLSVTETITMQAHRVIYLLVLIGIAAVGGYASVVAQQVEPVKPTPKTDGKFEFEIIESFDSKYAGDTPGHIGKHGELGDIRPSVALGDPVFRGEQKIGTVTNLVWSRGHGSLEIEFDPEPNIRIAVGDLCWLKMGAPEKK